MTAFIIMEETSEITQHDTLPDPQHYPEYTFGFDVEIGTWWRVHRTASARSNAKSWVQLDPTNKSEGVPKNIRAAVLILGG